MMVKGRVVELVQVSDEGKSAGTRWTSECFSIFSKFLKKEKEEYRKS